VDEARFIDWYPIVQAVSNGRLTGHMCPECQGGPLESTSDGINVRMRCPDCSQGFEGKLAHGRDDALLAEADAMIARRTAKEGAQATQRRAPIDAVCAPAVGSPGTTVTGLPTPQRAPTRTPERRPEPWRWSLPSENNSADVEALSAWMEVVHAIHNGRRTGLRCPFCSEPLGDGINVRPPYIRVLCTVCGETFEGRVE
jgi:ribosomal protein L37AE/L43A